MEPTAVIRFILEITGNGTAASVVRLSLSTYLEVRLSITCMICMYELIRCICCENDFPKFSGAPHSISSSTTTPLPNNRPFREKTKPVSPISN